MLLTCRGFGNSVFSDLDKVGAHTLRRFTGDYDMFGNQILTAGKLRFDSVYRFKGQQSPAVILVDVDPNERRLQYDEMVLFSGMTRATVHLTLLMNQQNPLFGKFYEAMY